MDAQLKERFRSLHMGSRAFDSSSKPAGLLSVCEASSYKFLSLHLAKDKCVWSCSVCFDGTLVAPACWFGRSQSVSFSCHRAALQCIAYAGALALIAVAFLSPCTSCGCVLCLHRFFKALDCKLRVELQFGIAVFSAFKDSSRQSRSRAASVLVIVMTHRGTETKTGIPTCILDLMSLCGVYVALFCRAEQLRGATQQAAPRRLPDRVQLHLPAEVFRRQWAGDQQEGPLVHLQGPVERGPASQPASQSLMCTFF